MILRYELISLNMTIETVGFGVTDVGRKREQNEDAYVIDDELGLYVVCDGLGGHAAGETASALAIDTVRSVIAEARESLAKVAEGVSNYDHETLRTLTSKAVRKACVAVHEAATADPDLAGMGCTLTLLLVAGSKGVMAHVGDTRLYLFRDGAAWQLSSDHTFAEDLVRRGQLTPDAASTHPYSSALTRAIGAQEAVEVESLILDVLPDDLFVICSDGLTHYLEGLGELAAILNEESHEDSPRVLVDLANERGGRDNVTVVTVRVSSPDEGNQRVTEVVEDATRRLEAIRRVPMFRRARYADLIRVSNFAELRACDEGEVVFSKDRDEGQFCIALEEGLEVLGPEGAVRSLRPGDFIGAPCLLIDRPCRATLRVAAPTTVLLIRGSEFRALVRRRPYFGVLVLAELAQSLDTELASAGERIIDRLPQEARAWWNPRSWF